MYSLVIVDDEAATRNGLVRLIDWAGLSLHIAGVAQDGEEALPLIADKRPDLLLTDVKMPRMDGIQLARRAKEDNPAIKIIFISGYDELDYVKSALKMGASDYILKPIEIDELTECVKKAVAQLERERQAFSLEQDLQRSAEVLREQLISALIQGRLAYGKLTADQMANLSIPPQSHFAAAILSPDEEELEHVQGFQGNWRLLSVAVRNIASEVLQRYCGGDVVEDPGVPMQFTALFFAPAGTPLCAVAREACADIQENLLKYLGLSVTIAIGSLAASADTVEQSYSCASQTLRRRLYLGGAQLLCWEPDNGNPAPVPPPRILLERDELQGLLSGPEEKMSRWLDGFFQKLVNTKSTALSFYQGKASLIVYELFNVLRQQLPGSEEAGLSQQNVLEQLYRTQTIRQMKECILEFCRDIRNLMRMKEDSSTKSLIGKVKDKIRQRYFENLTINDLAKEVYLTPTYLCVLFHQQEGVTINQYLTNVRMETAKRLLSNLENKLYDVSYAVGYSNPSYFSRQFKKYAGMLPSEYRNRFGGAYEKS